MIKLLSFLMLQTYRLCIFAAATFFLAVAAFMWWKPPLYITFVPPSQDGTNTSQLWHQEFFTTLTRQHMATNCAKAGIIANLRAVKIYLPGIPQQSASGFLVDDTYILTAAHVIDTAAENGIFTFRVTGLHGTWGSPATLAGVAPRVALFPTAAERGKYPLPGGAYNRDADLALLKLNLVPSELKNLAPIGVETSPANTVSTVYASGIQSATIPGAIQTLSNHRTVSSPVIVPGDSGSGLLSCQSQNLIGLAVARNGFAYDAPSEEETAAIYPIPLEARYTTGSPLGTFLKQHWPNYGH